MRIIFIYIYILELIFQAITINYKQIAEHVSGEVSFLLPTWDHFPNPNPSFTVDFPMFYYSFSINGATMGPLWVPQKSLRWMFGFSLDFPSTIQLLGYLHLFNGHFRNLNWRYLPYIRPM